MTPDEYCQQKAAASGSSFYYSFLFLPTERRRAITALYAFCREVDDVVDEVSDASVAGAKWLAVVAFVGLGTAAAVHVAAPSVRSKATAFAAALTFSIVHFCVLGCPPVALISASLTFNLQLAYMKDNDNHKSVVWGEATLEVEIDVLFLSFSVSVKCRREFGGSEGDPKFIQLIPDSSTWVEYCQAFAAEAV
jgi:hypothetical protein